MARFRKFSPFYMQIFHIITALNAILFSSAFDFESRTISHVCTFLLFLVVFHKQYQILCKNDLKGVDCEEEYNELAESKQCPS